MSDSIYKLTSENKDARVKTYRFTVDSADHRDVVALKAQIKEINKTIRGRNELIMKYMKDGILKSHNIGGKWIKAPFSSADLHDTYRVRVMGRGARKSNLATARAKGYIGDLQAYLPMEFAEYFDVYVGHNREVEAKRIANKLGYSTAWDMDKAISASWNVITDL